MPEFISRRQFLTTVAEVGLVGAITRSPIIHLANSVERSEERESQKLIDEILEYRAQLKLSGLPTELKDWNEVPDEWRTQPTKFENGLPSEVYSFGMYVSQLMSTIYGPNSERIVWGIEVNPENPFSLRFDSSSHKVQLDPYYIDQMPFVPDFAGLILHEGVGHGSDPAFSPHYPRSILLKVTHGKWAALSQAFSVENQFFQHPGDAMLPKLKLLIGKDAGYLFLYEDLIGNVDDRGQKVVQHHIREIAREINTTPSKLRFNKWVSRELGGRLIESLLQNELNFHGHLYDEYDKYLSLFLTEIYAEAVRYSILYPEDINYNYNVVDGIEEVLTAIQSNPVSLGRIRRDILKGPSSEIIQRRLQESTGHRLPPNPNSMTDKRLEELRAEQDAVIAFIREGRLPLNINTNSSEQLNIIQRYANACAQVVRQYPTLATNPNLFNAEFDPWLNFDSIVQIHVATYNETIRNIIQGKDVTDQMTGIEASITILENFINSDAFGTNHFPTTSSRW